MKDTDIIMNNLFGDIPAEVRAEVELQFDVATRIAEVLKAKGVSQKELAERLNKKEAEISKWLTGTHNFTLKTLALISNALGEKIVDVPREPEIYFVPIETYIDRKINNYTFFLNRGSNVFLVDTFCNISPNHVTS